MHQAAARAKSESSTTVLGKRSKDDEEHERGSGNSGGSSTQKRSKNGRVSCKEVEVIVLDGDSDDDVFEPKVKKKASMSTKEKVLAGLAATGIGSSVSKSNGNGHTALSVAAPAPALFLKDDDTFLAHSLASVDNSLYPSSTKPSLGAGADTNNYDEDDEDDDDGFSRDGLPEYNKKVELICLKFPLDLRNESEESLPPVLKEVFKAMEVLVEMVSDAMHIYSLALEQADHNECPNVMAGLAAAVVLAAQRGPPTVSELQPLISKFKRMCWTEGKSETFSELLSGTGVTVKQAKAWTKLLYEKLDGGRGYFLKWFLSPATVEGDHTASPFVALFILLSSIIEENTLPSASKWAEIFITAQEGLALARKCSVSLATLRRFFPNAKNAVSLSEQIRDVWLFNGEQLFNLRKPSKAVLKDDMLKGVADSLGLKNDKVDVNSSGDIPDDDSLFKAMMRYTEIERDNKGRIVKVCGINGCIFKGHSIDINYHRQEGHGVDVFGDGKERDRWGRIIKVCGVDGCEYRTGDSMKNHKVSKHGIGIGVPSHRIVSCDELGCNHKGRADLLKTHKANAHNIDVEWHFCNECDYKAKKADNLKQHKADVHNVDVKWHFCNECDYKAKKADNLKQHKADVHNVDVKWHFCNECDYKAKQVGNLRRHKQTQHN